MSSASEERSERAWPLGRPWGVALLVWVGICCTLAPVLLAELQRYGPGHFSTSTGSLQLLVFARNALLYPGLLLPVLIVLMPRWSAVLCGLLLAGCVALLVLTLLQDAPVVRSLAFWGSRVLPATLIAVATLLAYRRRDWPGANLDRPAA